MARVLQDLYTVTVVGLGTPISNLDTVRAGLDATLVKHPRFSSIRVIMDNIPGGNGTPRWVRTAVNLDDHLIVPDLDPITMSANPDEVLEDYVSSLSTLPMDLSRPLWEFHVLNFPTSETTSAVILRIHHALGDGTSLLSLFLACTRSVADQETHPTMPPAPARRRTTQGPVYALPRPAWSVGVLAFAVWILSYVVLVWNTVVDVTCFVAFLTFAGDRRTIFTGVKGVESRRKRFVSQSLSLGDVKHVKNVLGCTVNDVLVGVSSAALSRYYFRKLGDHATKKGICLSSLLVVNLRPTPGIQKLARMMEAGKNNDVRWGNRVGYIMLPFQVAMHNDPLEYVRIAKKIADRKKRSFEAIFTHATIVMATKLFGVKVSGALINRIISRTTMPFSNLIGPAEPVELYGHPVVYIAPSVYGLATALTVHWQSYGDSIRVILAVDDAQFPDCHQLLADFSQSLKMIRDETSTMS